MKAWRFYLPHLFIFVSSVALCLYGPIAQLANYHHFADQTLYFGLPNFADVISNVGFALVALWGWSSLFPLRKQPALENSWVAYRLFLIGLFLTAFGSAHYHLAPNNDSLVWDRIPIVLACAGLLAGVYADCRQKNTAKLTNWLALAAVFSVFWWWLSSELGKTFGEIVGDLRPYILLQASPMVLIPLWQWIYQRPKAERWGFAAALILYALAKITEIYDHQIAAFSTQFLTPYLLSGHTLKHLFATLAAFFIVRTIKQNVPATA